MLTDQLYRTDEQYLPVDEVIRRIAPAFRRVSFDWCRGDARIRENYERMVALQTPEIILQSQRALFGMSVWVSVADDDEPDACVEFLLLPDGGVFIDYRSEADRERLRPTVHKIAGVLGYQVAERESHDS